MLENGIASGDVPAVSLGRSKEKRIHTGYEALEAEETEYFVYP